MGVRAVVSRHMDLSSIPRFLFLSFFLSCRSLSCLFSSLLSIFLHCTLFLHILFFLSSFHYPSFLCPMLGPFFSFINMSDASHLSLLQCFSPVRLATSKSQRGGEYGYSVPIIFLYSYLYYTTLSTSAFRSDKTHISCVVLHDVADNHRQ